MWADCHAERISRALHVALFVTVLVLVDGFPGEVSARDQEQHRQERVPRPGPTWQAHFPCWLDPGWLCVPQGEGLALEYVYSRRCRVAEVLGVEWEREYLARSVRDTNVYTGGTSFVVSAIAWGVGCEAEWALQVSHLQRSEKALLVKPGFEDDYTLWASMADSSISCEMHDPDAEDPHVKSVRVSLPRNFATQIQAAWFHFMYAARHVPRSTEDLMEMEGTTSDGRMKETRARFWVSGERWNTTHLAARFFDTPSGSPNQLFESLALALREIAFEGITSERLNRANTIASQLVEAVRKEQ